MQTRRLTASLAVGLVALAGAAACRTSPTVAAYVGDEQVTVVELESAVEERLADETVAAAVGDAEAVFTRQVLGRLVAAEVYEEVADRYDIAVSNADVQQRIDQLLEGRDAEAEYAQAAAAGFGRADVFEDVRQQIIRERLAVAEGLTSGLDEAALQARYEQVRDQRGQAELGLITVPDQATADAVLAQLVADPATYPALAARYPGATTLQAPQAFPLGGLPAELTEAIAAAGPAAGFTQAIPAAGGVVVGYVYDLTYPTFEELRPELEQEAAAIAAEEATALVAEVREDLDITVNPRFGVLEEDTIVEAEGEVVDILEVGSGDGTAGAGD